MTGFLTPADHCAVPGIVERHASERPGGVFVTYEDGSAWTWSEAREEMWRAAGVLARLGVGRGDRVLVFLPNGPGFVRAWCGTNALGAVMVPVNLAYKGSMLDHVCADSRSDLIVTTPDLAARLEGLPSAASVRVVDVDELEQGDAGGPPGQRVALDPWNLYTVNYTSGTTGPSKGVATTFLQTYTAGFQVWGGKLGPEDAVLVDIPLFHLGGQSASIQAWSAGARVALRTTFSGTGYFDVIRETGATSGLLVGTMAAYLLAQPPRADDRDHTLRHLVVVPMVADPPAFMERFGVDVLSTSFAMTEVATPLAADTPLDEPTSCGRPRPGAEVRVVDEHDVPVGPGEVGELVVRTDKPYEITPGYLGRPEATARAWRNGWFHTGDAFTYDAAGNFYFVDRIKDALRRRGENISSFEVEREVAAHPDVVEAACVAAPGELGEDEVKVFVVPRDGAVVDPAALVEFLIPRMPHFMVPRFVEVVPELPKTPTMRVRKFELRSLGNRDGTWDREAAGIRVRRD